MTNRDVAVVILAAGKGTRMQSRLPKVLHPISGVPMINYVLSNSGAISPKSTSVIIGPGMDQVREHIAKWDKKIKCIVQKGQKGTGDAVKQAIHLKNFKGTVLILFGDTPFITNETMQVMTEQLYEGQNTALVLLGFMPQDPAEYGRIVIGKDNRVQEIVEYRDANEEQRAIGLCNAGVMAVRGDLLFSMLGKIKPHNAKKEYYLTDLVKVARGLKYGCDVIEVSEDEVIGINTRDQLAYAEAVVQDYLRWEAMSNGATLRAPETVYLQHDTQIGKDVTIHPHVVFGSGVTIEDEVEIKSFSHIEGAHIKSGATIGPFARIRSGTVIGEDAKVGNFVEIKNSELEKGAKASHLSYIGDTRVGKSANIGAGTITCNYDGKKKHRTDIGEGAFIGSNTSLIAPVKVGKGAVIGAGSTITKDVKPNSTVINQMPQKELKKGK